MAAQPVTSVEDTYWYLIGLILLLALVSLVYLLGVVLGYLPDPTRLVYLVSVGPSEASARRLQRLVALSLPVLVRERPAAVAVVGPTDSAVPDHVEYGLVDLVGGVVLDGVLLGG